MCGHVLAYSENKGVAYICPMDMMFDDIKRTLGADSIGLPSNNEPGLVDMAEHGEGLRFDFNELAYKGEEDDAETGASEADVSDVGDDEDMLSDDDDRIALASTKATRAYLSRAQNGISDGGARRKKRDLRIDTPSATGLGLRLQGLGITTESPPRKEEQLLAHRLRDMSPSLDHSSAFRAQMLHSPISGEPIH